VRAAYEGCRTSRAQPRIGGCLARCNGMAAKLKAVLGAGRSARKTIVLRDAATLSVYLAHLLRLLECLEPNRAAVIIMGSRVWVIWSRLSLQQASQRRSWLQLKRWTMRGRRLRGGSGCDGNGCNRRRPAVSEEEGNHKARHYARPCAAAATAPQRRGGEREPSKREVHAAVHCGESAAKDSCRHEQGGMRLSSLLAMSMLAASGRGGVHDSVADRWGGSIGAEPGCAAEPSRE
jgi:hypothetical protein